MINGQDNALLGAFFDTIGGGVLLLLCGGRGLYIVATGPRSKPPDTVRAVTTVTTTSPPLKPGAST